MTANDPKGGYMIPDNTIIEAAQSIGDTLVKAYPAVVPEGYGEAVAIPDNAVADISETITLVVAEILQAWLNAGSEREVTMENLYDHVEREVKSWSVSGWKESPS